MAMFGNMMSRPLLVSSILTHAESVNPQQEIVTATGGGAVHRYTYADFANRTRRLAACLLQRGLKAGDRIGTLAWNTHRHLEIYYATAGVGMICHTINPRLHLDQIAFIINDAQDSILFYDIQFQWLVDELKPQCKFVQHWIRLDEPHDLPADDDLSVYSTGSTRRTL